MGEEDRIFQGEPFSSFSHFHTMVTLRGKEKEKKGETQDCIWLRIYDLENNSFMGGGCGRGEFLILINHGCKTTVD